MPHKQCPDTGRHGSALLRRKGIDCPLQESIEERRITKTLAGITSRVGALAVTTPSSPKPGVPARCVFPRLAAFLLHEPLRRCFSTMWAWISPRTLTMMLCFFYSSFAFPLFSLSSLCWLTRILGCSVSVVAEIRTTCTEMHVCAGLWTAGRHAWLKQRARCEEPFRKSWCHTRSQNLVSLGPLKRRMRR